MKKTILLAVVLLATAIVPSLASATPGDVNGPACADVVGAQLLYNSQKQVRAIVHLAAPSCAYVTYTLVVLDDATGQELVRFSEAGDRTSPLIIAGLSGDDDSAICVYVETSVGNGKHVFDRALDAGCATLLAGGLPPGFDFN